MRGQSDDSAVADDASDRVGREIVLADVDAVGAAEPRDVGAIVDHEDGTRLTRQRRDGGRFFEESRTRDGFSAQLQERGAAVEKRAREID
jgi:hypothetical protein